jgi:acetoin utilization deacetylase AcuC-like enzyme
LKIIFDVAATTYGKVGHPERPERLLRTQPHLERAFPEWGWEKPGLAENQVLLLAHDQAHLTRLKGGTDFDSDTPCYPRIDQHARRAVGAALSAARIARQGERAFSLMRPPGHHATRNRAMGFCYLNSIAIAALKALEEGCERVAIWDFDAHHGNGTEAIVAGNPRLRFASIHQHPCYPGTGTRSFKNIFNRPVPPMTDPETHAAACREALDQLLTFEPDLLLVSAGFDAFSGDPITNLRLEPEHFHLFGQWLRELPTPVAAILEGGYSEKLPMLIESFLLGWERG